MSERGRDLLAAVLSLLLVALPALAHQLPQGELAVPCGQPAMPPAEPQLLQRSPALGLLRPSAVVCDGAGEELRGAAALLFGRAIEVNRASADELAAVPGISARLAERIVNDRLAGGPYRSLDQMARVPGLGPRRLTQLAPFLVCGP